MGNNSGPFDRKVELVDKIADLLTGTDDLEKPTGNRLNDSLQRIAEAIEKGDINVGGGDSNGGNDTGNGGSGETGGTGNSENSGYSTDDAEYVSEQTSTLAEE